MPTCKCRDCRECASRLQSEKQLDPPENRHKQGPNHSEYPKSRKQLEDVLKQAEKDLWYHIDALEAVKAGKWGGWSISWHREMIARISREIAYVQAYVQEVELLKKRAKGPFTDLDKW